MKITKNKLSTAIITLMVILWVPLGASAADMWAETPALNDIPPGSPSVTMDSILLAKEK